jgi:hypothetical protein
MVKSRDHAVPARDRIHVIGVGRLGADVLRILNAQGALLEVSSMLVSMDPMVLERGPRVDRRILIGLEDDLATALGPLPSAVVLVPDRSEALLATEIGALARAAGALAVAVVPGTWSAPDEHWDYLRSEVDTVIEVPEGAAGLRLDGVPQTLPDLLAWGVEGLAVSLTGWDVRDLYKQLRGRGTGRLGVGSASGADRARRAIDMAIRSPLLGGVGLREWSAARLCLRGDFALEEMDQAVSRMREAVGVDVTVCATDTDWSGYVVAYLYLAGLRTG